MNGFLDAFTGKSQFKNRYDAGLSIASEFGDVISALHGNGVVLGLPRGGVEVAAAVARSLNLPLDFRSVKKVGHPFFPEFAIGAVDISGVTVINPFVPPIEMPSDEEFRLMADRAIEQVKILEIEFRGDRPSKIALADFCLIVDDGAATGLTILAAVRGLKSEGKTIYVAVPVASRQAEKMLSDEADGFFSVIIPPNFESVGQFYDDFGQLSASDVLKYLDSTNQ